MSAIAKAIGLSMADFKLLFATVNEGYFRNFQDHSEAYVIVDDAVDTLESMAITGEDISGFINGWTLMPAQKARLQAASLSPEKRTRFLLDFLSHVRAMGTDNQQLAERHLFRTRADVGKLIMEKMQDMATHPQKYNIPPKKLPKAWVRYTGNYMALFHAANASQDARFKPLLRRFIDGVPGADFKEIKNDAAQELSDMGMKYQERILIGRWSVTLHKMPH